MNIKTEYKTFLLLLLSAMLFASCFNEKKLIYFQKTPNHGDTVEVSKIYVPKIQTGDILSIYVNSLSPEASSFFNPYSANAVTAPTTDGMGLSQGSAPGYLVDSTGNIDLPLVGAISVKGLTTTQAHDIIKDSLNVYLKDPTVIVRFLNYRISILGEVSRPGIYVIPNESVTIPEAITMAGDVTNFANRDDLQIIRSVKDKKEFGSVSLLKRDLFSSPYYYLHANDIVYVKATKTKVTQTDVLFKAVPFILTIVTAAILILTKL